MVTIALASLLIGGTILGRGGIFVESCWHGTWIFYFPSGIYRRTEIQYAGIYAETGIFCDRCAGYFRSIFEKQWPQIKRRMTHRKGVQ